ncbi:hypothetical protein Salat_1647700 [Sesamum alatum]|uniref:TRF2/HOY1 PH-like domain-containing protein n=1 Tax=Sesamum alatum TaxID=300844 RepID=A0AAE1Y7K2_9LAMI|nr:hypothetical protein Salat_1647700 [Sesamum alatum]
MQGSSRTKGGYKKRKNSEFSLNTNMAGGREDTDAFCNEEEEEQGLDDDFQDNLNPKQSDQIQTINVHRHSPSTVIGRSPVFSLKELGPESSSPIGLTLRRTPSFLELLQNRLFVLSQVRVSRKDNEGGSDHNRPRRRTNNVGSPSTSEKLKASNFPIKYINIGRWERNSRHEGHLVAKLYYAKKKLVWEILSSRLKNKIEMLWSDISAIRATLQDDEEGLLEIELNKPPSFFGETDPQPRKHTIWHPSPDFTGGQASIFRVHTVVFPAGVLDRHYEKLLGCDDRLFELSRKPFPSQESPVFNLVSSLGVSPLPLNCNRLLGSSFPSTVLEYPYPPHSTMARATPTRVTPSPATTVMNFPFQNELSRNMDMYTFGNQGMDFLRGNIGIDIGGPRFISSQAQGNMAMITSSSSNYYPNALALNSIEEHLLGDSQVVCSDYATLMTNVSSMCSILCPTNGQSRSQLDCRITNTASTSHVMMPEVTERYNVLNLRGFCSEAMNCLPLPLPPPPPLPPSSNDPIVMGPFLPSNPAGVVPPFMPSNSAHIIPNQFMRPNNPTDTVDFRTMYCDQDPKIEGN